MAFADLHIHSYFSDGTMSPIEILNEVIKKDVTVLSITDHDILQGSNELIRLCNNSNILCISGVELDSLQYGINYHILGYGVNLKDPLLIERTAANREKLERVNTKLIERMATDYQTVSLDDYNRFSYNKEQGGWKALHYFVYKGITQNLVDGFSFYSKYENSYVGADFPNIKEICHWIHQAGGKSILAHPGKVIKSVCKKDFDIKLRRLLSYGLDGIECYYPTHTEEVTGICLAICKELNLIVTSGSDCHGAFEKTSIGQMLTPIELTDVDRL